MSQTATCEIELDALPRLEHGTSLLHVKSLQAQTPDVLTEDLKGEYFPGDATSGYANAMDSGHTLVSPEQARETVKLRIGNIVIEDKALYLAGACMGSFVAGLNFTATGANLPSFQDHYHLSYETVSLVFLAGFGGYLVSCVLNSVLQSVIGTCNVLLMAGILNGGGALLISFAPPFPLVVVGLCLMGFGAGFYEACLTSVISHFEDGRLMNIIYAFAGLGALVSPFVIGALTQANAPWKLYYWFPLSLTIFFAICHFMLFKNYVTPLDHEEAPENKSVRARFGLVMRMPMTWLGMVLMVLSYAIVDVLSNWLTSYLIDVKGAAPDVSRYQLAMFWAGLTAGRIFFSLPRIHLHERMGNALLLVSMCGAIGLLWTVRSTASDWVAIAVAGFFLGPNTPGILSIISTRVPPSLKGIVVSITIGSALVGGTLGSLIFGITVGKVSPGLRMLGPFIMSQTATCELELDVLPQLEHGAMKHLSSDGLANNLNEEHFSGVTTSNRMNTIDSGYTLVDPARTKKTIELCIGNIIVEDKILHLMGACMGIFAAGLNFTATGANLPSFQVHYNLSYETVSLVFLAGFGGYLLSCVLNSVLQSVIGTCNVLLMAGALYGGGALLISFAPPFPVVVVGLCLMGFGGGFYEACLTTVVSHFEDSRFMNITYAFSGLGALVSPFIIGALTKANVSWKFYYWFPFSLTMLFIVCHFMLFKNYTTPQDREEASEHKNVRERLKLAIRMPVTWVGTVLIVCSYAIVDVLSNWLTSYLINVKGSAPDISRYQLSVFWAGLTVGRIFFSLPLIHIRERAGNNLLLALTGGSIGLLWALDNTASNWIAIAVAGFFLGPNTPGILSIVSTRVPPSLKEIIISVIVGAALVGGTLGSLIFGVTVGKISAGLRLLPPVIIVLASTGSRR
ncbi:unnamed protein product [Rhizoctonia solani]|uniref:Major facilitator superfamily (MFS) profile domain-containing protein n=1 Tax=Rhizoctonia solani TaxID=456999 RepID=A0A8H3DVH0_9AGAM|nr:unnamed protein product [Rhizoctonia solani]